MAAEPAPDLERLLAPRSIAVVGGAPAERVVAQCLRLGFDGPIWPVNPGRATLGGLACFASVADLPGVPDAVFIGVNRFATIETVRAAKAIGAGGAVCYSSGFAEVGDHHLQHELLAAAGGMPFFGPNCYGFVNAFDRVALWPDEHGCEPLTEGVAIVSQSGNVAVNLTFQQRGLRLGAMITVGNQAGLGAEDAVAALLGDPRITAIGLFVEAVRDAQHFAATAERACERGVPLVALQTGRSDAGARIATSHTGSMAGRAAVYDALFARYGVATVRTPAELLETLKLLDAGGPLRGRRIVSLSCSGGEASLVADRAERTALDFAPFAAEHRHRIAATLSELVAISNPFDYHTFMWGDRAAMASTFTAVLDGPQDATMLVLDAPPAAGNDPSTWYVAADALADAAHATGARAVVVATLAECINEPFRRHIVAAGLTPLMGLGEGLVALEAAALVGRRRQQGKHAAADAPGATCVVDEADAKARLRTAGIAVPAGRAVARSDVLATAEEIGYPITLKTLGLAHKSEHGAVHVGLPDHHAVSTALTTMPENGHGYLVESTVTDIVAEMLVAVRRDPPVGWLVTVGHGGVTTEVWGDLTHLLAPVTTEEVLAALGDLRCAPLLRGFRGRPAADVASLARLVADVAEFAVARGLVELELNPVLVGTSGAVAVDALMIEEDLQ